MKTTVKKCMKLHIKYLFCIVLVLSSCSSIIRETSGSLSLKMSNKNWKLLLDIPNLEYFMLSETHVTKDYANIQAVIRPDWAIKINIGDINPGENIEKFIHRTVLINDLRHMSISDESFKKEESSYIKDFKGEVATIEYFVKDIGGIDLRMKRKIICLFYDNVSADIQIAKLHYTPEDEETFKKLINSIKIIED